MTKKELVQDIRTAKGLLEVNKIADAHLFLDKLKRRILEEGVSSAVQPMVICEYCGKEMKSKKALVCHKCFKLLQEL